VNCEPRTAKLEPQSVVLGTRGSALALWQANHVAARLGAAGVAVRLEAIRTTGDKILDVPLARVGGKALFVKEIEEALLAGRVDLAVHSMKDVPTQLPAGLAVAAVPRREDPGDVLLSRTGAPLAGLRRGAVVGTSSLRRQAQLLAHRPDLAVVPLRGNLDTRIRKLEGEGLDAIVLAAAGIRRLGLESRITERLAPEVCLPAVGQGALGIEIRQTSAERRAPSAEGSEPATGNRQPATAQRDARIAELVGSLDDRDSHLAVRAERAMLLRLGGGCQVPIAGYAVVTAGELLLRALVATVDGRTLVRAEGRGPAEAPDRLGAEVAESLLFRGAAAILAEILETEGGIR
jgi:hydroxymethylbilane synthase